MEELQPQEFEESRQELEGESAGEEALSPEVEIMDHTEAERLHVGWGFLALWVPALSVAGAVSCRSGAGRGLTSTWTSVRVRGGGEAPKAVLRWLRCSRNR